MVLALAAVLGGGHFFTKRSGMIVVQSSADQVSLAAATLRRGLLVNPATGLVIDVSNPDGGFGANIQVHRNHGGPNQLWELKTNGQLKNPSSNMCLVVWGGLAEGRDVKLHPCHDWENQQFFWQKDGTFQLPGVPGSQLCMDIFNPGGNTATLTEGKNVQVHACHGAPNQIWKIE